MSARVYFMKTVNGCKYVSIMSPQDEQWRQTSLLCLYTAIFLFYYKYNRMQSKHKKQNVNILQITAFSVWYQYLIKEVFKKTISNSSLNSHVYWDTLFLSFFPGCRVSKLLMQKWQVFSDAKLDLQNKCGLSRLQQKFTIKKHILICSIIIKNFIFKLTFSSVMSRQSAPIFQHSLFV